MRIPLQYQIMLPLAAVALASLLAVALINSELATQETESTIQGQLQGVVGVLANSNFPLTDAVLRQMKGLSGAEFVLVDEQSRRVSASLHEGTNELPSAHVIETGHKVMLGPQIVIEGDAYFHSAIRLPRPLGSTESGVLHILFPRQQYDKAWRRSFFPPLLVGVASVVAIALVTQWIASRVSRDLAKLGAGVRRLAGGDCAPLGLPRRDDEVRDLAVAVNQTAARLSDYEDHIRQTEQVRTIAMLGAGLAHEMRNAATGCRLAVDLHAENCRSSGEDDALSVARSQLELMESRLQSYLQLGRRGSDSVRREVNLADLVDSVVPWVRPSGRHAGVTIHWHRPDETAVVLADEDSLRMVIVNLLLNAIEAARKQSTDALQPPTVWISVQHDAHGFAKLTVADSGPGPQGSIAERLFEPFVTTKAEGVGLGLAVAREVAQSHGGELSRSREEGRTQFTLRLPLAANALAHKRNGEHAEDSGSR